MAIHLASRPTDLPLWRANTDSRREPEAAPSLLHAADDASPRYWILVLGAESARLYQGLQMRLDLADERTHQAVSVEPQRFDADPDLLQAEKDQARFAFLRRVEHVVSEIIDAEPHPLVVVGHGRGLASFFALSRQRQRIVGVVRSEQHRTPSSAQVLLDWPLLTAAILRQQVRPPAGRGAEGPQRSAPRPRGAAPRLSGRGQCDDD